MIKTLSASPSGNRGHVLLASDVGPGSVLKTPEARKLATQAAARVVGRCGFSGFGKSGFVKAADLPTDRAPTIDDSISDAEMFAAGATEGGGLWLQEFIFEGSLG